MFINVIPSNSEAVTLTANKSFTEEQFNNSYDSAISKTNGRIVVGRDEDNVRIYKVNDSVDGFELITTVDLADGNNTNNIRVAIQGSLMCLVRNKTAQTNRTVTILEDTSGGNWSTYNQTDFSTLKNTSPIVRISTGGSHVAVAWSDEIKFYRVSGSWVANGSLSGASFDVMQNSPMGVDGSDIRFVCGLGVYKSSGGSWSLESGSVTIGSLEGACMNSTGSKIYKYNTTTDTMYEYSRDGSSWSLDDTHTSFFGVSGQVSSFEANAEMNLVSVYHNGTFYYKNKTSDGWDDGYTSVLYSGSPPNMTVKSQFIDNSSITLNALDTDTGAFTYGMRTDYNHDQRIV